MGSLYDYDIEFFAINDFESSMNVRFVYLGKCVYVCLEDAIVIRVGKGGSQRAPNRKRPLGQFARCVEPELRLR